MVEVSPKDFTPEIQRQLMIHGLSQKLGDSYAGEDADKCHAIFTGTLKSLTDGTWSSRSGGGGGPRISQLAEAFSRAVGQPVEACVSKLAEMTDDQKAAVRKHPQVVSALAEIKLEKAKADAKKAKEASKAGDPEGEAPVDLGALMA